MKIGVIAITGMFSLMACGLMAAEIDSKVIHNYKYLSAGYGYLHDIADSDINAHGAVGEFSFEDHNFLIGFSGGYFWAENTGSTDVNLWNANASLGYVFRVMENHINIIPRIEGSYSGIDIDDPTFGTADDQTWSILPGASLSFALCNWFAVHGGYTYAYNFDTEDEDHLLNAGAKFAIVDQIGLSVDAVFSKEFGFSGITGMLEFHY